MTIEERPTTPGIAIASLVCGILGFFTCFFTGIPAIITGHLAQKKINKSEGTLGGKKLALTGLILGYVTTVLSIFPLAALVTPAVFKALEKANAATNISNCKEIHKGLTMYAMDNGGKYPASLKELGSSGAISDLNAYQYVVGPGQDSSQSWTYYPNLTNKDANDKIIMSGPIIEGTPPKRILLFVGGSAQLTSETEAQDMAIEQSVSLP